MYLSSLLEMHTRETVVTGLFHYQLIIRACRPGGNGGSQCGLFYGPWIPADAHNRATVVNSLV